MLEIHLAAKLLPVRILHPSVYYFLVRHVVHMLQHLQTHHQASGFAGAPLIRAIQGSEAFVEHRPVDDVVQLQSEQVELSLIRRFFRDYFSLRNCKELTMNYNVTCNFRTVIMEYYININSMLCTIY